MAQPIQYQGMPLISTPVIDPDGSMNLVWYRFFTSLFNRSGLNTPEFGINAPNRFDGALKQNVYPQFMATSPTSSSTKVLSMFDQTTGHFIGFMTYTP